jgi:hypothetical protein
MLFSQSVSHHSEKPYCPFFPLRLSIRQEVVHHYGFLKPVSQDHNKRLRFQSQAPFRLIYKKIDFRPALSDISRPHLVAPGRTRNKNCPSLSVTRHSGAS